MTFYSDMATVADELLTEFGVAVTFTRTSGGSYDPLTGSVIGNASLSWTGVVVVQQASKGTIESFDVRFESGTLIESNLRSLLISAKIERAPSPGDVVALEGASWTLVGVTPLNPAGTPLIYTATAKR